MNSENLFCMHCDSRPAIVEKQLVSGKPGTFFAVQISFAPIWHCTGFVLHLFLSGLALYRILSAAFFCSGLALYQACSASFFCSGLALYRACSTTFSAPALPDTTSLVLQLSFLGVSHIFGLHDSFFGSALAAYSSFSAAFSLAESLS